MSQISYKPHPFHVDVSFLTKESSSGVRAPLSASDNYMYLFMFKSITFYICIYSIYIYIYIYI